MYIKLLRALSSCLKLAKILCQEEFQFCIKPVVYSFTKLGVALDVVCFHICMVDLISSFLYFSILETFFGVNP